MIDFFRETLLVRLYMIFSGTQAQGLSGYATKIFTRFGYGIVFLIINSNWHMVSLLMLTYAYYIHYSCNSMQWIGKERGRKSLRKPAGSLEKNESMPFLLIFIVYYCKLTNFIDNSFISVLLLSYGAVLVYQNKNLCRSQLRGFRKDPIAQ